MRILKFISQTLLSKTTIKLCFVKEQTKTTTTTTTTTSVYKEMSKTQVTDQPMEPRGRDIEHKHTQARLQLK